MAGFRLLRNVLALLAVFAVVLQGTLVLAGTTGALSGTLVDDSTKAPLVGARVSAVSPSQSATATTDAAGHFTFLSLAPDTYIISVEKTGYNTATQQGVTITADQTTNLTVGAVQSVKTIGRVTSRTASDLVRPGTTSDVYSVTAEDQAKLNGLGGGGTGNSGWSAASSVPGIYVAPNQAGYIGAGANVSIRGGDYNQIGYELDGVPINRSFDNYPSGSLSSLGQQELQVYTGAAPTNSESQGLSGYINQVIKTGTYPGFKNVTLGVGGSAFYNHAAVEVGGATANRNFSYYVAAGGYNQNFRYYDNFNGATLTNPYGLALGACQGPGDAAASCTVGGKPVAANYGVETGSIALGNPSTIKERDGVVNLHFGIPHRNGYLKDDVQLLLQSTLLNTQVYSSDNDLGGVAYLNALGYGPNAYLDGLVYNGPTGGLLNLTTGPKLVSTYLFPSSPQQRAAGALIDPNTRDGYNNDQGIMKLQYTRAFSDTSLLKVYGYTYYSDWLQNGPNSTVAPGLCCGQSADYELSAHTRGISAAWTNQWGPHTVALQGSSTSSTVLRANNTSMATSNSRLFFLVDSTNPTNGICYKGAAGAAVATATLCTAAASTITLAQLQAGATSAAGLTGGARDFSANTCGGGPCAYIIAGNGQNSTYNQVVPTFTAYSLTDNWKATSRLTINYGVRVDDYNFQGANTVGTPARTFWFNAYNLDYCLNNSTGLASVKATLATVCPAGTSPLNLVNASAQSFNYNVVQPRVAGTLQLSDSTVLRASYGRFVQAPNSAFEQYNTLQPNLPATLLPSTLAGFNTPGHQILPPTSNNADFSIEHRFTGTDVSVKLSPFLRKTQNQIQQFYLNQLTNFVSGLNVGRQTSQGFEFELDKGDFNKNGLSGKVAFTYTNSYIQYSSLANGLNVFSGINTDVKTYNAYTSFCAANPTDSRCGSTSTGVTAGPCYTAAGAPAALVGGACAAGNTANPYWSLPVQSLFSATANNVPFDITAGGPESSAVSYGAPYVLVAAVNYKRNRFAVTPTAQFIAGQRYGAPETWLGPDPASPGSTLNAIPDQLSGVFDAPGAFRQPSNLLVHMQMRYELTNDVQLTANLNNIVNSCFGGTQWKGAYVGNACGYTVIAGGLGVVPTTVAPPAGQVTQSLLQYPYAPTFRTFPFMFSVEAKFKIQ